MDKIYLDYAAGTPLADEVARTLDELEGLYFNPSAIYLDGQRAGELIAGKRQAAAKVLGAKPAEIIFTSGATEADNLAIGGILKASPGRVAVCATEHKAVFEAAKHYGRAADIIDVDKHGLVRPAALKKAIKDDTVLVCIALADSEIGAVQNMRALLPIIQDIRLKRGDSGRPLYLHCDASQAANFLDLHVSRLGVDTLALGGSKMYGPKSSGLLYVRFGVKLEPILFGGGQERGLRSGTEDPAKIAGLVQALELAQSRRVQDSRRLAALRDRLANQLSKLKNLQIHGDRRHQLPNFLNLSMPGADGERLVMKLDEYGVLASTGAACSIRSDQPSHVLKAIGLSDKQAGGSLRFTLGRGTTDKDVDQAAKIIARVVSS